MIESQIIIIKLIVFLYDDIYSPKNFSDKLSPNGLIENLTFLITQIANFISVYCLCLNLS